MLQEQEVSTSHSEPNINGINLPGTPNINSHPSLKQGVEPRHTDAISGHIQISNTSPDASSHVLETTHEDTQAQRSIPPLPPHHPEPEHKLNDDIIGTRPKPIITHTHYGSIPSMPSNIEDIIAAHPSLRHQRVRFRSRVRVASGISHHRSHELNPSNAYEIHHPSGTSVSSRSSSFSVALQTENDTMNSRLGPLGQRISGLRALNALMTQQYGYGSNENGKCKGKAPITNEQALLDDEGRDDEPLVGERKPLLGGGFNRRRNFDEDSLEREREIEEAALEEYFGPWPNRILNPYWWWWLIEPVVCCHCQCLADEEDDD